MESHEFIVNLYTVHPATDTLLQQVNVLGQSDSTATLLQLKGKKRQGTVI